MEDQGALKSLFKTNRLMSFITFIIIITIFSVSRSYVVVQYGLGSLRRRFAPCFSTVASELLVANKVNVLTSKMSSKRKNGEKSATVSKEARRKVDQEEDFIVVRHRHDDDYTRADSESSVYKAFKTALPAYVQSVCKNIEDNIEDELDTCSETLLTEHNKKAASKKKKVAELKVEDLVRTIKSIKDIQVVQKIYEEVMSTMNQKEAEYTMRPYETVYTVYPVIPE